MKVISFRSGLPINEMVEEVVALEERLCGYKVSKAQIFERAISEWCEARKHQIQAILDLDKKNRR